MPEEDRAADAMGKNRSGSMLKASRRDAQAVLLDRRHFVPDDAAADAFWARLDAPTEENGPLRRLLEAKPTWDR